MICPSLEAFAEVLDNNDAAGATPGINREPFRIKLDEPWYTYPDVIEGEHDLQASLAR